MNNQNPSQLYASDQHEERSASPNGQSSSASRASSAEVQSYPMTPMSASSSPDPRAIAFSQASPQPPDAPGNVAPISTNAPPTQSSYLDLSATIYQPPFIPFSAPQDNQAIYRVFPDGKIMMEKQVRQFATSDGTSFIEHVPGHCLVFIPNSANIGHVVRELRKIRPQRAPRPRQKDKSAKPTNAFIKYRNHKISELKTMYPDISQTEISRMAGICWDSESESVKIEFRKRYLEEKRIYDLNKAKRQCTGSSSVSDNEGTGLGSQTPTSSVPGGGSGSSSSGNSSVGSTPEFGLGLGLGGDGRPVGFNTGRRRSHTLPPGDFSRSRAKRRISQELRKHLANKNNAYYAALAANSNTSPSVNGMDSSYSHSAGYVSGDSSISTNTTIGTGNDLLFANTDMSQQQAQHQYEFTFIAPVPEIPSGHTSIPPPPSSVSTGLGSPYLGYSSSSMAMPLNPSFPIAEFSGADGAMPHTPHGHSRSLTNIGSGISLGSSAFTAVNAHCNQEGLAPFVPSASSLAESTIATSLPLIDTTNIAAFGGDNMSIDGLGGGYMSADTTQLNTATSTLPTPNAYSTLATDYTYPTARQQ
ncbi:hypothetical protein GGI11_004826 [Coemansia sp. RSA 2049]|nr:hypothetical protein GGI11_004826 [Coemansia sp. RSA 2049]